tara:strand:- start:418 stop:1689 length:1272 start_codon:yes stop_codon:yes gene_type:complete
MKVVEFLTPQRDSHIIVADYTKDFLIKNKYKILPKNIYLKRLILFLNLKFFRKIKAIIALLLKCSIKFQDPIKRENIIFDKESSEIIEKVLRKSDYMVLPTRIKHFKEIFISKKILYLFFKNFFKRSLKINYLSCLIDIMEPKRIITAIDTSIDFFKISKIFRKKGVKTIAIQSSTKHDGHLSFNFDVEEYFTLGEFEKFELKKYFKNTKKIKSIGSLRAVLAKDFLLKKNIPLKKKFDICLFSETNIEINKDGFLKTKNPEEIIARIAEFTIKFCAKHNKKMIFTGKALEDDYKKELEILFYKKHLKSDKFKLDFNKTIEMGTYKNIASSDLTIGFNTTAIRESFAFKKKTLCCSFAGSDDTKFPGVGIHILKSNTYEDFEQRVLNLLELSYEEYLSKIENVDHIYNTKIDTIKFLKQEICN